MSAGGSTPSERVVIRSVARPMFTLEPLIARLVEDILRAIGEATLAELEALAEPAIAAALRTPIRPGHAAGSRGTRRGQASAHTGSRSRARTTKGHAPTGAPEPRGVDDITDPEQLLVPLPLPASTEPIIVPTKMAESHALVESVQLPASRIQHADQPQTPLRAGESLARSSAAGIVIRRAKRT
jgi:hypothetical protein